MMMSMVMMISMLMMMMSGAGAGAELKEGLFVFGDSYADTGNHRNGGSEASAGEYKPWRRPYGISFPGFPTGRYSDGHAFTDLYAKHLGVRKPITYRRYTEAANANANAKHKEKRWTNGINFAFGGSGVFPTADFCPNVSTQILRLRDVIQKQSIHSQLLLQSFINASTALLTVNGNDYTQYLSTFNGDVTNISTFIRAVVQQIGSDIVSLHHLGFKKLAISNIAPVGCLPIITHTINFTSCLTSFNALAVLHNSLLEAKIQTLKNQLPAHLEFINLDFYSAFNATLLGWKSSASRSKFRPCCEGIGDAARCGSVDSNGAPLYTVCESPNRSFFWDDFHPTNAAWRKVSAFFGRRR